MPAARADAVLGHATLHTAVPFSGFRRREGLSVSSQQWDERYGGDELVWTSTPNQFLVAGVPAFPPGGRWTSPAARVVTRSGSRNRVGR